jgi:secondary thiamine-phosphate synthase enzyme
MWLQKKIIIGAKTRGFHLVTSEVLRQIPELRNFKVGLGHFFLQHTSASLAINENADPSVRVDMESGFNNLVPENQHYFTHTQEGPDDMPAHLKAGIIGTDLTIPLAQGRLQLGTWQGIYFCEHRDYAGERNIIVTLTGE